MMPQQLDYPVLTHHLFGLYEMDKEYTSENGIHEKYHAESKGMVARPPCRQQIQLVV